MSGPNETDVRSLQPSPRPCISIFPYYIWKRKKKEEKKTEEERRRKMSPHSMAVHLIPPPFQRLRMESMVPFAIQLMAVNSIPICVYGGRKPMQWAINHNIILQLGK